MEFCVNYIYCPKVWRTNPEDKKQGSSETETVEWLLVNEEKISSTVKRLYNRAINLYNDMIAADVCAEQARMVLPQSLMTEWYWSGTLYAFARICNLRCAEDAQYETRIVANLINDECERLFPISWIELRKT